MQIARKVFQIWLELKSMGSPKATFHLYLQCSTSKEAAERDVSYAMDIMNFEMNSTHDSMGHKCVMHWYAAVGPSCMVYVYTPFFTLQLLT